MARPVKIRLLSASLGLALAITGVVAVAARASSTPQLPPITAQALLASVISAAESSGPPVSGRVTTHLDLGFPSLPDALAGRGPGGASTLLNELSGEHHFRVWSSPDGIRVAELLFAAERSITVSRTDAWAWDSTTFTAYHLGSIPKLGAAPDLTTPGMPADLADPGRLAAHLLAGADPTTSVTVGTADRVAGRACYVLVLEPRSSATLVGRIEIGIDAVTRVPLSVTVFPRGSSRSAIRVAFTAVSFDPIDPTTFRFSPPAGATVVTPHASTPGAQPSDRQLPIQPSSSYVPKVIGTGWSTVVAVPVTVDPGLLQSSPLGKALAELLPFSGRLFSIRLVQHGDDHWLLYGLVPQSALAAMESELP